MGAASLLLPGVRVTRISWDVFKIQSRAAWELYLHRVRLIELIRSRAM